METFHSLLQENLSELSAQIQDSVLDILKQKSQWKYFKFTLYLTY